MTVFIVEYQNLVKMRIPLQDRIAPARDDASDIAVRVIQAHVSDSSG
jgi:hypothetical protein